MYPPLNRPRIFQALKGGIWSLRNRGGDARLRLELLTRVKAVTAVATAPVDAIAMWSGTLATKPANWNLCDGTGTTPNLVARFVRGVNTSATNPGTTGGADSHLHTEQAAGAHTHVLSTTDGAHTHAKTSSVQVVVGPSALLRGATSGGGHTHGASDSQGSHIHVVTSDDGRPPYYEVAFIQAAAGALVAVGLIIIWTGLLAAIPVGWDLCDGGASRPDLRSRFVRGINTNVTNPGTTGGATTHQHTGQSGTTFDTHTHTSASDGAHTHGSALNFQASTTIQSASSAGTHTHTLQSPALLHTHTFVAASSLPAYFDVAFIYNSSASTIPSGGILIWAELLANIPTGYALCDGNGGRPNLIAVFLRGSNVGVEPGGTGGSDSHTHTDENVGAHQHTPDTQWATHVHPASGLEYAAGTTYTNMTAYGGSHNHTLSDSQGNHQHTVDPADTRPAYYEVAFIYKA